MSQRQDRPRIVDLVYAAWLTLITGAGLVAEIGRIPTRFSEWPGRIAALLGLAGGP